MFKWSIKRNANNLDEKVLEIQNGNEQLHNEILQNYQPFIMKVLYKTCGRYITQNDDEFSIGLMAFDEALSTFSPQKGASFLTFAELVIKRRTLTYLEKQKTRHQVSSLEVTDGENQTNYMESHVSIEQFNERTEQEQRMQEIKEFQKKLNEFGITFNELVEQSPKHQDSKRSAKRIAKLIAEDKALTEYLFLKKRLPIKDLLKRTDVSRKTIERMRKYLIALTLIYINTEFIYLKEYMKGVE